MMKMVRLLNGLCKILLQFNNVILTDSMCVYL